MGKKNKSSAGRDDVPGVNATVNRDIIQRLNFLYQASVYLNQLGTEDTIESTKQSVALIGDPVTSGISPTVIVGGSEDKRGKMKAGKRRLTTPHNLSRTYVRAMKVIGQKTTVRMDPSVKRTICKSCNVVLVPGLSASVRVKTSPSFGHAITYTCLTCSTPRRIPAPPIKTPTFYPSPTYEFKAIVGASVVEESAPDPESQGDINMDVPEGDEPKPEIAKRQRKSVQPRPLPFFAREEHVIFAGNQRLFKDE